jgi:hypothetical protein
MFVMFDMYVKLSPDASPITVNKFTYLLTSIRNFIFEEFDKFLYEDKGKVNQLLTWPGREGTGSKRLPRFQDNWHIMAVMLPALNTGRLHPPGNIPGTHFC